MTDTILETSATEEILLVPSDADRDSARFSYRILEASDFPEYIRLRARALEELPEVFEFTPEEDANLNEDMKRSEFAMLTGIGAFQGDRLVGMGFLTRYLIQKLQHRCQLTWFYVAPECRGASVAKGILERAISLAGEAGCQQIELTVFERASVAISIYKRHGFKVIGRNPNAMLVNGRSHEMLLLARSISG